jgi:hypothetical protein
MGEKHEAFKDNIVGGAVDNPSIDNTFSPSTIEQPAIVGSSYEEAKNSNILD